MPENRETIIALRARREALQIATAVMRGRARVADPVVCVECGNRFIQPEDSPQQMSCPACTARRASTSLPFDDPIPAAVSLAEAGAAAGRLTAASEGWIAGERSLDDVRQGIWAYVRVLPAAWHLVGEMVKFIRQLDELDDDVTPDRGKAVDVISRLTARILWLHPDADPKYIEQRAQQLEAAAAEIVQAVEAYRRGEISLAGVREGLRVYLEALAGQLPLARVMSDMLIDLKEAEFKPSTPDSRRILDLLDHLTDQLCTLHALPRPDATL